MPLPTLLARPLVRWWLDYSPSSWRRRIIASDSPHVHAPGLNPDRVLIAGDGVATGRGVLTHDLGLPGHLARSLSQQTGHATDVDIVVDEDMTVRSCADALAGIDLLRYDIVVLSLGHNEALALMSPASWKASLETLLADLALRAPAATEIFILPVPIFGPHSPLPAVLAGVVDDHARDLNAVTAELTAEMLRVSLLRGTDVGEYRLETVHLYRAWADGIASEISDGLDPDRLSAGDTAVADEASRQKALAYLEGLGTEEDPVLDDLTERARQAFGTSIAAITLVRRDTQTMTSVSGMAPVLLARDQAICDTTIRRSRHLVIEDATTDSRFSDYHVVTGPLGVRSYAGYPIESPDGHRVGALCVMDTAPRRFSPQDIALLRSLAQLAQKRLWERADRSAD